MITAYRLFSPSSTRPVQRFITKLDQDYRVEYRYNNRSLVWTLHLETLDGLILTTGQTIKPRRNLIDRTQIPGSLWCQWGDPYRADVPSLADFDDGLCVLRYYL